MKYLLAILLYSIPVLGCYAQVLPQAINFQGVARADNGRLIKNTVIGLRLTIIDKADGNKEIYREKHADTTDNYGFFSLQVGRPISVDKLPNSVDFVNIPWQTGDKFLKIEFDTTAGQTFPINLGTMEMVTVPFAFAARSVTNIHDKDAQQGNALVFDGVNWVPGFQAPKVIMTDVRYSIKNDDQLVMVDASNNDVDITLPKASGSENRLTIRLAKPGNDVYILTQNNESINLGNFQSNDSISIQVDGDFVELISDGTNWVCLKRHLQVFVHSDQANYQLIPNQKSTAINFDRERTDTYNSFENTTGSFSVPPGGSGIYNFQGLFYCLPALDEWDAGDQFRVFYNYKGGNTTFGSSRIQLDHTRLLTETVTSSFSIFLDEGESIRLFTSQESGNNANLLSSRVWITREN